MRDNFKANLSERFIEYQYFFSERAYYPALKRLAQIYHCLPKMDKAERVKWEARLGEATVTREFIAAAKTGMAEELSQIRQILSVGSTWNDDEILLILTMRIQIDLALSFVAEHSLRKVTIVTDDIDESIKRIAVSKENARAFDMAVALIKKNWGLPITSRWLLKP